MEEKLEYEEFAPLFGKWASLFKPFIEGKEMYDIYQRIKEDAKKEIIAPKSSDTFRVFEKSDPNNVKVVWYLMDPYPKRYKNKILQATGIAMDCSNSPDGKLQPSLEIFYDAIKKDLNEDIFYSPSLEYLVEQGVLLLNTELTCKLLKTGSHKGLWEPFQKYFLQNIMGSKTNTIYVLSGEASHKMEKHINPLGNHIFKTEHPVAAGRRHMDWNCDHIFSKINRIIESNSHGKIFWNKERWDYYNTPPF